MSYLILFVYDENSDRESFNSQLASIRTQIDQHYDEKYVTVIDSNPEDALLSLNADSSICAVCVDWTDKSAVGARDLYSAARTISPDFPTFLLVQAECYTDTPADIMELSTELVWPIEDTEDFIAKRIILSAEKYIAKIIPPLTSAMIDFAERSEYSWHTPGHAGGTAFRKTAVGREFFDYYGETLFRNDLSISVGELGSLLDHSGPIGESEKYISKVFGSDRSYSVTNGTSTSNRVVYEASVTKDDIALVDRNCHKSVEQSLTLTGARPAYLMPLRNYLGIIGPIPLASLKSKALAKNIKNSALTKDLKDKTPRHVTITNSTYDGLLYNAKDVVETLKSSVNRIHFDEAWYGYARFNPLYAGRFAMYGEAKDVDRDGPTVFATQSTHKLLAAFSQASYIHVRDGKDAIAPELFNESFMMNASTSPFYPIIASNEVSAAMMDEAGERLTGLCIEEAIDFRQNIMRYHRDFAKKGEWFFTTWQADKVKVPRKKLPVDFADADPEFLAKDPDSWVLHPGDDWHGFKNIPDGYCMLDPIKVSIVTPGVKRNGKLEKGDDTKRPGIPAMLLSLYLDTKGIINEKTNDFTVLVLFSMGITKGKWGTLASAMLQFKRDYDANASLDDVFPDLVAAYGGRYSDYGLKDLADEMFDQIKFSGQIEAENNAFGELPKAEITPQAAYQKLVHGEVEQVRITDAAGRIAATGIVPYPPGIPLIMPGELIEKGGNHLAYLSALESFDRGFKGFEHDSHGVEIKGGNYYIYVLK
jgi:lysine decarboxylase/arginine decarboxylase